MSAPLHTVYEQPILTFLPVCPYCCNCLTIARTVPSNQYPTGVNAFTCRTCPYQFALDQPYYERTYMKRKQKDDILGEGQTDLPTIEGNNETFTTVSPSSDLLQSPEDVPPRLVPRRKHFSGKCRLAAQTSRQPHFIAVLSAPNSGENTEKHFIAM